MIYRRSVVAATMPVDFVTDGCSGVPDHLFGADLTGACRIHDAAYCTRLWPAGTLTQKWRGDADYDLGKHVRELLPWGGRWIGWLFYRVLHRLGGDNAFDSCGIEEGERCRHNVRAPAWLVE